MVNTPLLEEPLTGPVYLRASDNRLPDLVIDLHGPPSRPLHFEASARIDSIKGGIRNTFTNIPDVPFSKLTLRLPGGKKGLLQNSRNLCSGTNRAKVSYTAHNGLTAGARPVVKAKCPKNPAGSLERQRTGVVGDSAGVRRGYLAGLDRRPQQGEPVPQVEGVGHQ